MIVPLMSFDIKAGVVGGNSRTWFEFFWVPLIPFKKSRIWICTICREHPSAAYQLGSILMMNTEWEMKQGDGPDPQPPQQGFGRPPPPQQPHQPGYGQQHV
uniref:Uncharacterized protein n=1 Tax=Kwoniella pini CBS 10737 TaxID=1296096 RepID=A0A1B9IEQ7_9TREE|nr:uncharacterized protein I206_01221 [Kwoniella pini CBS 10737]OCF53914.1 hypothetical protein I206_01221 [Kwoniella pini CBS 10737]